MSSRDSNQNLYREISDGINNGMPPGVALERIAEQFGMSIEPKTQRVFSMMLDESKKVKRFSRHGNLTDKTRGNVALHTLQVMPVIAEILMKAFPEIFPQYEGDGTVRIAVPMSGNELQSNVKDTLLEMLDQVLMHDFGEIFVELSSLSQRMKEGKNDELPKVERSLAEFSMRLAFYAINHEDALKAEGFANSEAFYSKTITDIRASLGDVKTINESIVGSAFAREILNKIEPLKERYMLDILPRNDVSEIRKYMGAYDEPEGHSHFAHFNGAVVKNMQNTQTVIHMNEHVGTQGAPPYELAPSKDVIGTLWYSERGLPKLYQEAGQNPFKLRIAQQAAILSFEANLGVVEHASVPKIVDRAANYHNLLPPLASHDQVTRAESYAEDVDARKQEIQSAVERYRKNGDAHYMNFLRSDLSKLQLRLLNRALLSEAKLNPEFRAQQMEGGKSYNQSSVLPDWLQERIKQEAQELKKEKGMPQAFDHSETFFRQLAAR